MAGNGISRRQERALAALLECPTITEASEKSGVGLRTIHRWLANHSAFQQALAEARRRLVDDAVRLLQRECSASVEALAEVRDSAISIPGARVSAAKAILDFALKVELDAIEQRLATLERILGETAHGPR